MSTLASNITPFEALLTKKPDLSYLCVWGCQCFVTIPTELCTKAGPCRFEAIFVGYEEARVGWTVHDLKRKIHVLALYSMKIYLVVSAFLDQLLQLLLLPSTYQLILFMIAY